MTTAKWYVFLTVFQFVAKNLFTHIVDMGIVEWPEHTAIQETVEWKYYSVYVVALMILLSVLILSYYYFSMIIIVFKTSSTCAKLRRTQDKHLVYHLRRKISGLLFLSALLLVLAVLDAMYTRECIHKSNQLQN